MSCHSWYLYESGARVVLSSDYDVGSLSPFDGMARAVDRGDGQQDAARARTSADGDVQPVPVGQKNRLRRVHSAASRIGRFRTQAAIVTSSVRVLSIVSRVSRPKGVESSRRKTSAASRST